MASAQKKVGRVCEIEGRPGKLYWLVRQCRDNSRIKEVGNDADTGETVNSSQVKNPHKHEEAPAEGVPSTATETQPSSTPEAGNTSGKPGKK